MARQPVAYKKIPGHWRALFIRRTLWQGPDHLLWVEKSMMQEQYRRFYFKDIQAVIVRCNLRQHLWTVLWTILIFVTGALALRASKTPDLPEFFVPAGFTLLWSVGLLINFLKGPCCEFYLQTAVQLERLTSMARRRSALKTADRIKELAEKTQGPFQGTLALGAAAGTMASIPAEHSRKPFEPRWHLALFSLLLCQGVLGGLQLWLRQSWVVALGLFALGATIVLSIITLARSQRQVKGTLLGIITWLTLALIGANALSAYGIFIFTTTRSPEYAYNQAALFRAFLELHLEDNTLIMAIVTGFAAGALMLGLIGLIAVFLRDGRSGSGS